MSLRMSKISGANAIVKATISCNRFAVGNTKFQLLWELFSMAGKHRKRTATLNIGVWASVVGLSCLVHSHQ